MPAPLTDQQLAALAPKRPPTPEEIAAIMGQRNAAVGSAPVPRAPTVAERAAVPITATNPGPPTPAQIAAIMGQRNAAVGSAPVPRAPTADERAATVRINAEPARKAAEAETLAAINADRLANPVKYSTPLTLSEQEAVSLGAIEEDGLANPLPDTSVAPDLSVLALNPYQDVDQRQMAGGVSQQARAVAGGAAPAGGRTSREIALDPNLTSAQRVAEFRGNNFQGAVATAMDKTLTPTQKADAFRRKPFNWRDIPVTPQNQADIIAIAQAITIPGQTIPTTIEQAMKILVGNGL